MRFPVRIAVLAHGTLDSVEQVVEAYPQLSLEQVRAALEYYRTRPERVDEDIERNARALKEITGRPWPV